jgi:hypothetical protein
MIVKMFATLDRAKPVIENIRGSNLVAIMCTTVQVSWWLQLQSVGHNLLYRALTDAGLVYIVYIYIYIYIYKPHVKYEKCK